MRQVERLKRIITSRYAPKITQRKNNVRHYQNGYSIVIIQNVQPATNDKLPRLYNSRIKIVNRDINNVNYQRNQRLTANKLHLRLFII